MTKLTAKKRNELPAKEFALPKDRKYPMPDKAHAANAKTRATQQEDKGKLSAAAKAKIDAKANKLLGKKQSKEHIKTGYLGKDSREGRLHNAKTGRGTFRFKDNKKGE